MTSYKTYEDVELANGTFLTIDVRDVTHLITYTVAPVKNDNCITRRTTYLWVKSNDHDYKEDKVYEIKHYSFIKEILLERTKDLGATTKTGGTYSFSADGTKIKRCTFTIYNWFHNR